MRVRKRHGNESTSEEWRLRALRSVVAVFAALVVSFTLTAAASANVSFIKAYGWGVLDGANQFETCTTSCLADSAANGIRGGGAGQLNGAYDVATDSSGDVYVADAGNYRIDEFSAAGAFIEAYGWGVSDGASQFETCTSTCQAGITGGGAGEFSLSGPASVAIDPSGDVYVADSDNERIDEFSAAGSFLKAYGWGVTGGAGFETCSSTCQHGNKGAGAGQLLVPDGVATDSSGDVYVADARDYRIDEFSAGGSFIKAYGWGVSDGTGQFETCTSTCQQGLYGGGAGQLDYPIGVTTDSSGDVYVADYVNQRVDEFSAGGSFIKAYGWGVSDGGGQFETCTSTCEAGWGGGGAGQFHNPAGVATDSSGDVYVGDSARIDEFSGSPSPGPPAVAPPANTSPPTVPPPNNTSYTLSVSLTGTGTGSVSGSGVSCPGTCLNSYASGTVVGLTETPSARSTFAGWSGCTWTDADFCGVTITADRGVTARFTRKKPSCGTTAVARLICAAKKLKSVAACGAEIVAWAPLKALKFIKVIKGLYNTHKYPEALRPVYQLYDFLMKVRFRNGLTGAEVWKKLQRAKSISELVGDVADSIILGFDPSGEHFQELAKGFADLVGVGDCVDVALARYEQD